MSTVTTYIMQSSGYKHTMLILLICAGAVVVLLGKGALYLLTHLGEACKILLGLLFFYAMFIYPLFN